jgi:tripartite-type tricarboxylate transporter receptor subunit TctC
VTREGSGWNGIFVPAGTPPAIVAKLQQEIVRVLLSKEVQDDALTPGTQAGGIKVE